MQSFIRKQRRKENLCAFFIIAALRELLMLNSSPAGKNILSVCFGINVV